MAEKITISAPFSQETRSLGRIGRVGENLSRQIVFDCSSALTDRPNANIICVIQRTGDKEPYAAQMTRVGDTGSYKLVLTSTEVAKSGSVRFELRMVDGDEILKAAIYTGTVEASMSGIGDTPGEPIPDALNRLESAITEVGKYADLKEKVDALSDVGLSATGAAADQVPTADGAGNWAWKDQQGGSGGSVEVDATLTSAGKAADAKATGDELGKVTNNVNDILNSSEVKIRSSSTNVIHAPWFPEGGIVDSISLDNGNNYCWEFNGKIEAYVGAFVEISSKDEFMSKEYEVRLYNNSQSSLTVVIHITSSGEAWSPYGYVVARVTLLPKQLSTIPVIGSVYSEISAQSSTAYIALESVAIPDQDCKLEIAIIEKKSSPRLGPAVTAVTAVTAVNAVNAVNATNAVNGKFIEWHKMEGLTDAQFFLNENNKYQIKFGAGENTSSICILSTHSIGKVSELRNKKIIVEFHNNNADTPIDISNGWGLASTDVYNQQWGQDKVQICDLHTLGQRKYSTITAYEFLDRGDTAYADDADVYLRINNRDSYGSQAPYSLDICFSAWLIDKDYGQSSGLVIDTRLADFVPSDYAKSADVDSKIAKLQGQIGGSGDYIVCWGDSLTAGGGWTSTLETLSGMPVYNAGTGGENAQTIVARQGADVMQLDALTIPADTTPVTIATRAEGGIPTAFGYKVTPLLQGGGEHVNPVSIGGINGTLSWTGTNYADSAGTWTFTRAEAGEAITINRPTAMRTNYDKTKNAPHLMVIFIGQNGGYDGVDGLIRQHRLMIEHSRAKHYVVLGLSSGSAADRASYESAMQKEFGRYFISLREYLAHPIKNSNGEIVSCYGLADQGLEPGVKEYNGVSYNALEEIASGTVPHQILADTVHYTSGTKTVIGNMLYKKCCELGIFDS